MIENKKVITGSLIFLFLILSIVYSLTYQKKQSIFKAPNITGNNIQTNSVDQNEGVGSQASVNTTNTTSKKSTDSISLGGIIPAKDSQKEKNNSVSLSTSNDKLLPGTTEYLGTLDIVRIFSQKPKYILQDSRGNYFVYYGDHLDFAKTIQTLGGNIYEMVTESEILQNQLFGDRVSYINLSMFKDVRVIMVVEIDGETRLLQIPADKYHYSKDYLRSLFVQ